MIFATVNSIPAIYPTWDSYHAATFDPDSVYTCHPLKTYGRTYNERRENLRQLAIDIQSETAENPGLSYGELATLQEFFTVKGRKYGLLTEFKQNGII